MADHNEMLSSLSMIPSHYEVDLFEQRIQLEYIGNVFFKKKSVLATLGGSSWTLSIIPDLAWAPGPVVQLSIHCSREFIFKNIKPLVFQRIAEASLLVLCPALGQFVGSEKFNFLL
jgi:hypothetical protein